MTQTPSHPTELKLHRHSRVLEVLFADGAHFHLPVEYLRVYSPSAEVRGHGPGQGRLQVGKEQVNIDALEPAGAYGVKIFFDDGHKTGIYDWRYLRMLGERAPALWEMYLDRLAEAGETRQGPDPFTALADAD